MKENRVESEKHVIWILLFLAMFNFFSDMKRKADVLPNDQAFTFIEK